MEIEEDCITFFKENYNFSIENFTDGDIKKLINDLKKLLKILK